MHLLLDWWLSRGPICYIFTYIYIHSYIHTHTLMHIHPYMCVCVEPLLSNIIHSKLRFDYWFVQKLKQCCSGWLNQPFGCVWFVSAVILICSFSIGFTRMIKLRTFVQWLRHFFLNFFYQTLNCSTWESFNNWSSNIYIYICCAFNKFPDFFVQAFKIVVDSWKFTMLLLYILWDDWPIFMISSLNKQLQQELEYTLLKPDCHWW